MKLVNRAAALLAALALAACSATPLRVAESYRHAGHDELAARFAIAEVRTRGRSPEAVTMLDETTTRAVNGLMQQSQGDATAAKLAYVYRSAALLAEARAVQATVPSAKTWVDAADNLYRALGQNALRGLDRMEVQANGQGNKAQLAVVERAAAFAADDPELGRRLSALRAQLTKRVRLVGECSSQPRTCEALLGMVRQRLMGREALLLAVIDDADAPHDFEVRLSLLAKVDEGQWEVERKGKGEAKVERYDRFNELVRNDKGDPVKDVVDATYLVYRRASMASVSVDVSIHDQRQHKKLGAQAVQKLASDERRYLAFDGDERAVAGLIASVGTDRRSPVDTQQLTVEAATAASDEVALWIRKTLD